MSQNQKFGNGTFFLNGLKSSVSISNLQLLLLLPGKWRDLIITEPTTFSRSSLTLYTIYNLPSRHLHVQS